MDHKVELLGRLPLFADLERRDLEALAAQCEETDVPAGKVLAEQGHRGTEFFVLADGAVSVERDGAHVRDLGPGAWFGELALLANIARTATVTTTQPSRLIILGAREFAALRMDHPQIESNLLRTVAERLASLEHDHPH